jgi:sugar phosphate permease
LPPLSATRRSWLVWLTAASVYLVAVFHRASFGVAGLEAAERFGIGAAALGVFTVLQIGVYAGMQIPTGVLVDRFGSRAMLTTALLVLGTGQILVAVADAYWIALLARGVVGLGDALTFVSVLRLAAGHFPARQYTLVTGLTATLGFIGNLAATTPLALLLSGPGWTSTFLAAGVATVLFAFAVRAVVRNTPPGVRPIAARRSSVRETGGQIAAAWRVPGTRLGFWTHFATTFAPATLSLLWGVPYLVQGQGRSATTASSLLMVFVFGAMVGAPLVGAFTGRRPELRMPLVIGYLAGALAVWSTLIAWPGQVPVGVVIAAFAYLSLGFPASAIGFALARDYNPLPRVGTATGVVNVGGFLAITVSSLLIGVVLQVSGGDFRAAFGVLVAMMLLGSWRIAVWYRRARAVVLLAQARGEDAPVRLRRRRWDAPPCSARPTAEAVIATQPNS